MRVMHILNTGLYSGAENVVITLIKSMPSDVESIYMSLEGDIKEILNDNGICHYLVNKITPSTVKEAIVKCKPDIIHSHDYTTGVMAALSGTRIPIINHLHNNAPWIKKITLRSFLYLATTIRYSIILTVSDAIQNEFIFGKFIRNKCVTIGNPIDINNIREKAKQGNSEQQYDIAFMGRVSEAKNPQLFVDIVKLLVEEIPNLNAVMIGDGELYPVIESYIKENGLQENIRMLGFQGNPYVVLKNAKILCMPSRWEGFGLAAVEALALGKPVICSGAGGLKTIINDKCGKICLTIKDYREEIKNLLNNEAYYILKSREATQVAEKFDNVSEYRNQIYSYYRALKKG